MAYVHLIVSSHISALSKSCYSYSAKQFQSKTYATINNVPAKFQSAVYRNHSVLDFPVAEHIDEIQLQPHQIVYLTTLRETQLHSIKTIHYHQLAASQVSVLAII